MSKYDLNEQAGEDAGDVSKINAAGLINLRVQSSWDACTRFYRGGMFDELRDELGALWPEFYADASTDQRKEHIQINKKIASFLKERNGSKTKSDWKISDGKYKHSIYSKWLFLKTLEKNQGVGKAYRDEGADEWE